MSERTYSVLRIFLASPSDVQKEREIIREVVDRLNTAIGRNLGVHVELRGWEDTPPGRGRPQDEINEVLRRCDIFLGLLWKTWGTNPGGDNEYESGFEEEFNLACELHDQGEIEEVAVYFKEISGVSPDSMEGVQQVVDFKESIDRELLFGTFQTARDWRELIYDHLATYLTKKYAASESGEAHQAPRRLPVPEGETEIVRPDASLVAVLGNLGDENNALSPLEKARAHLYTQSLVNGSVYRAAVLNAEELAFLYGARQRLDLTSPEHLSVYRTLLADNEKVKSGWYWLDLNTEQLDQLLAHTATQSPIYTARSHARDLLRSVDQAAYRQVIRKIVDGDNVKEADSALGPFVEDPEEEDLEFLHTLVDEHQGDVAETAWRGVLILKAETDANEAIEWIRDTPKEQRGRYSDLMDDLLEDADTEHLRTLLTVEAKKNRAKVVDALRGELASGELHELVQEDNLEVAAVALMELIERGEDISDQFINNRLLPQRPQPLSSNAGAGGLLAAFSGPMGPSIYSRREVLRALYRTWSHDKLEEGVEWSSNGTLRYQILIEEYHDMHGDQLRADIQSGFQRYETRTLEAIIQGQDAGQDDSFTIGCFYRAAFQVLANHTQPGDIEIAQDFLREPHDSTFTRKIVKDAFQIVAEHGGPDDIDLVWDYVTHDNIGVRRRAAALVLNLDPQRFQEHASALLNLDDWAIQGTVFRSALENEEELPREAVRQLLYSSESQTRRGALAYLIENMDETEQEELLDNYPQAEDIDFGFYYYDVVGWLDRLLFPPEPIREYYREELSGALDKTDDLVFTG
jgi:hypothetical protein